MSISEFCSEIDIKLYPKQLEILENFYNDHYRIMVAILGRRSGKDLLCLTIALNEACYLLKLDNPLKYYQLRGTSPIHILLVSPSAGHARILFTELKEKMISSDYFRDKIGHMEADKIFLLTPQDKKKQKKLLEDGLDNAAFKIKGSIVVMSAHHNSESLLGKRIFALIFNEATRETFKNVWNALAPSTADFIKNQKIESKIIVISSPRSKYDFLHQLFVSSDSLSVQYPTWDVNIAMSRKMLRDEFVFLSDEEFDMEFGGEFTSNENKTVSLRLLQSTINTLQGIARERAFKQNNEISYTDMIRTAINQYIDSQRIPG